MKKLTVLLSTMLIAVLFVTSTLSMGTANISDNKINNGELNYAAAETANFGQSGTTLQLISNGYRLDFVKDSAGYYVNFVNASGTTTFTNTTPVKVYVKTSLGGATMDSSYTESSFTAKYKTVTKTTYGYTCYGVVKSTKGSVYKFTDNYYLQNAQFAMERTVKVLYAASGDYGFESEYILKTTLSSKAISNFQLFMPSLVYNASSGYGSSKYWDPTVTSRTQLIAKETALGLPMVMLRSVNTNDVITLQHLEPEISCVWGGSSNGMVDNRIQYGSIGVDYANSTAGLTFCYPVREAGYHFDANISRSDAKTTDTHARYSENYVGSTHTYKIGIHGTSKSNFSTAMTESYKNAYLMESPNVPTMDISTIYKQNITLFDGEYKEFGTDGTKVAGVPFAIDLRDTRINEGYNFCSGFVGQQVPMGYQLYKYGTDNSNSSIKAKGKTVLDFWSSSKIVSSNTGEFNYWKWIAGNNSAGGNAETGDDRFLMRYVVDGSEGMLDAYVYAYKKGNNYTAWKTAALRNADILCAIQNSDGSWYRCYNRTGSLYTGSLANSTTDASSKLSSMVPIRYLYKCYELTGASKYLTAANKAAEFCYTQMYQNTGIYLGGATDLSSTPDKEGSIFAMYAFTSAYIKTGTAKYLEAAQHAAVAAASFTLAYDYAIPNLSSTSYDNLYNPWVNGGTMGYSRICAGTEYSDNFSAYAYYELYKVYILTGENVFYQMALLHQNATKSCTDYDGRVGYAYKAMMPEATVITTFAITEYDYYGSNVHGYGTTCRNWLPWSGIANIEPMTNMALTFGNMDMTKITSSLSTLKTTLTNYGLGGKIS